jgi:hypothetical protein
MASKILLGSTALAIQLNGGWDWARMFFSTYDGLEDFTAMHRVFVIQFNIFCSFSANTDYLYGIHTFVKV